MTTQQLLLAFVATATILATAAGLGTARRLRRYRPRPISWTCLRCGARFDHKARTRGEAWAWVGASLHGHAFMKHPPFDEDPDTPELTYAINMPPEWLERGTRKGPAQPKK